METSTTNTESHQMSDVAMAREYVSAIGGKASVQEKLARAFDKLSEMFPHKQDPENKWTERRVRAFWAREAAIVQFREMVELHRAAEAAKAERELIAQARKEHAEFIAKTARLTALLERQDEDFHRPQIEGMGGVMGRVDRPGTD